MTTDWDKRFVDLANHIAKWSKDPSTKVGSVIVDHDKRIIGLGYNGFPRGVPDHPEVYADKLTKYRFVVHAEANAILNANVGVKGMTMYATKYPCSECAKLIIQSGISRVISPPPSSEGKWMVDAEYSRMMFKQACVCVREVAL